MRRALLLGAILVGVGYGLFEARQLIAGPSLTITLPTDGSATSAPWIAVEGSAHNISFLTINDAPAYTDEEGHFYTILTPPPGLTTVTVAAVDRFGREVKEVVSINLLTYCQNNNETQG